MSKLDEAFHKISSDYKNGKIKWNSFRTEWFDEYEREHYCIDYYDYYYAENELYIIRDRLTNSMLFVKARSPYEAYVIQEETFEVSVGGIFRGRNYSHDDFIRDFCQHCSHYEDECNHLPIDADETIMVDFRKDCRDFDYCDEDHDW